MRGVAFFHIIYHMYVPYWSNNFVDFLQSSPSCAMRERESLYIYMYYMYIRESLCIYMIPTATRQHACTNMLSFWFLFFDVISDFCSLHSAVLRGKLEVCTMLTRAGGQTLVNLRQVKNRKSQLCSDSTLKAYWGPDFWEFLTERWCDVPALCRKQGAWQYSAGVCVCVCVCVCKCGWKRARTIERLCVCVFVKIHSNMLYEMYMQYVILAAQYYGIQSVRIHIAIM